MGNQAMAAALSSPPAKEREHRSFNPEPTATVSDVPLRRRWLVVKRLVGLVFGRPVIC